MPGLETARPRINIDPNLRNPESPYQVVLDEERSVELLRSNGVPEEQLARQTITISGRSPNPIVSRFMYADAFYAPLTRSLSVNLESKYRTYTRDLKDAADIAGKRVPPWLTLNFLGSVTTRRLGRYLSHAPEERGIAFASELLLKSLNKRLNITLLHESKHLIEWTTSRRPLLERLLTVGAITTGGALGYLVFSDPLLGLFHSNSPILEMMVRSGTTFVTGLGAFHIQYSFDPGERRANRFAKEKVNDPEWQNLIQLIPRSTPQFERIKKLHLKSEHKDSRFKKHKKKHGKK